MKLIIYLKCDYSSVFLLNVNNLQILIFEPKSWTKCDYVYAFVIIKILLDLKSSFSQVKL